MEYNYAFLILLLPFLSFLVLGLVGMKMKRPVAALIGTVLMGCVFAMSVYTAYEYFFAVGRDASTGMYPTVTVFNFTWLKFTELLTFNIGFRLSPISVLMLIVITTVSFMVHIYSFGYMAERDENYKVEEYEKGMQRFYAYLSLFTMSMLGLVVATNIFQMYLFWELVGVCSYLLIGFYYPKHAAVHASKKAFIVTRFADLFFLIGILFYSFYVGTFNYDLNAQPELNSALAGAAWVMPTALFLMFIGGAGKSAMFPLHIWLPDAMEGPTPVSALIHAATMVVAGVYQVASLFPIWVQYAPETLHYVAYIAAFTAFYAAAVACCQRDIKRGLAFSTISQIAYMLVALGVCFAVDNHHGGLGYMAGIFHLFTHAMFKALLFLCSGAIIVIIGSNFKEYMGGLHKYMPITNICFLIGCLAIAGIPPFAGFWSKDEIISACFQFSPFMGWFMTVVAGMTAFYMFRLYYRIFWWNKPDYSHHTPHDCEWVMTLPLIILAVISCVAGFIPFGSFVTYDGKELITHLDMGVAGTSVVVAVVAIVIATVLYRKENAMPDRIAGSMKTLHRAAYRRFYMDEIYQFVTHKIIFGIICKSIAWFDHTIVDGTMNALAAVTNRASFAIRKLQSGSIQMYVWVYLIGALLLAAVTFVVLI